MITVRIQAEITGYGGSSANVLGALDMGSGLFIVAKELAYGERVEGAIAVSNDPRSEQRDSLFDEDKLQGAIRLFFRAKATAMIEMLPSVTKFDPSHKIEANGLDENGSKYRLSPDVSNGNMAVLALVDAADRAYKAQAATDFSDELAEFFLTI
jgi:hypothetical protein